MRMAIKAALLTGVVAALALGFGCKKTDPTTQPGQYPTNTYPAGTAPATGYPNTYPTGTATTAPPPATGATPTGGVPCQTDNDPQCLFGRCLGGRCGACMSAADCKGGAACMQTPLGMACVPGGGAPAK
jgi:hypothetical protein